MTGRPEPRIVVGQSVPKAQLSIKSPIQKASLQITGLSPREAVMATMKHVENSDVGDYKVPATV